jgi:hypothetical protein
MDRQDLADRLYRTRKLTSPEEVQMFEELLEALFDPTDASRLSAFFRAFDDDTEQVGVMWGLVHAVEAYEPETYLREMAVATPLMLPHARDWVRILHYRVLNNTETCAMYRTVIAGLPTHPGQVVRSVLEEIAVSEPEFGNRIRDVLTTDHTGTGR